MSRRTERLASVIQQELASVIMRELHDPRLQGGFPSISRVKISPDMSIADVYVIVMGTAGQQKAALNALQHSAGLMRTRLTKQLTIRTAPFIKFHLDEAARKEIAILDLIRKATDEEDELKRHRDEAAGLIPGPQADATPDSSEVDRPTEGPASPAPDHPAPQAAAIHTLPDPPEQT